MPDPTFKTIWTLWLVFFGVVEFIAVKREGYGDTFSEYVWWLLGSGDDERDMWRWIARGAVALLFAWLIPHFFTKWEWFK